MWASFRAASALVRSTQRWRPTVRHARWYASGGGGGDTPLRIFFGSQTGTAQYFAQMLGMESESQDFTDCEVVDLSEYEPQEIMKEKLAVFMLACYGKGEPTDNAKEFYEWLMANEREPGMLAGVKYCVFGLGCKKTYPERYQAVGKAVDKRLEELGAERIITRGEGDDSGTLDSDFEAWKGNFWPQVKTALNMTGEVKDVERQFRFDLNVLGESDIIPEPHDTDMLAAKTPLTSVSAKVVVNRELQNTAASGRSTRHIELDVAGKLRYRTGDHVAILPQNDPVTVERLARIMNVYLDDTFTMEDTTAAAGEPPFPTPTTFRHALTRFVDISRPPRLSVVQALAQFARDQSEKEKLRSMARVGEEGTRAFEQMVTQGWTVYDVLTRFPSIRVPPSAMMELLPRLQSRWYSISSSNIVHPDRVHVTCAVVRHPLENGRIIRGVCSNFLARQLPLDPFAAVPIVVRNSPMFRPPAHQTPTILIGAGSGLAPLRGFMQERDHFFKAGEDMGPTLLYFGCRNEASDFIYGDEIRDMTQRGSLTAHTAFSHDQDELVFVQHRLAEQREQLWDLVHNQNAHVFVCGDAATMAKSVYQTFTRMAVDVGGMSEVDAEIYMKGLESTNRYCQDIFTSAAPGVEMSDIVL